MKEFNYEAAKNGAPVQTRDGRRVRIICWDRKTLSEFKIVALIESENEEEVCSYAEDGRFCTLGLDGFNLVSAPVKHKGWINICKSVKGHYYIWDAIYDSENEALSRAPGETIDTIEIEWEE